MGFLHSIFFIIFPIIINQFVVHIHVVAAKNVLKQGDELNSLDPTSTLVSTNGNFTMGFFTITDTKFIYLGIWNTNDKKARKVWVVNRDMPIISSGVLMIDESGTLKVIIRGGGTGSNTNTVMFDVSNEVGSGNTRAVLEDSGNFVLYDNAKQNQTLWQSFDHPTDILLPGMKIGYNLTTRQNWTLTSWLSTQNPATGAFTMSLEQIQNSPHLLVYQRGAVYWSSGPWKNGTFQELFGFPLSFPRKLNLIYDDSGMYFTFQTTASSVSILQLSYRGELIDGETNDMLTPTVYYCNDDGTCWSSLQHLKTPAWSWVVLAAILLISLLAAYWCYVRIIRMWYAKIQRRKREEQRRDYIHQLTGSHSFNYGDELEKGIKDAPDVKIFSLKAILAATNNFSNENKLGQGGYGPVYKGKMFDGQYIAVKRLSKTSLQGIEEFKNELILISKLQHTNLVRLYGCCIHHEEKMLIYEFLSNKSLDLFLFAEDKNKKINWRMRFNIIEGVAQGLLYLHKYSRMRVIHRDLKVNNVLLDENMNPKIADFGMARIFQQNVTEEITNRVVGTRGYMAPEYIMRGTFSTKTVLGY